MSNENKTSQMLKKKHVFLQEFIESIKKTKKDIY